MGATGVLTITGNYRQAAAGVLNVELGGLSPAQYDRLGVTGNATLDGALDVSLVSGFTPGVGNSFQVMTYGPRTGMFASIDGHGRTYMQTYNATNLTLTVQ